jgi:putative transposase
MSRKSRFSEQEIVYALKQVEAGVPLQELCRKYGVSEQTFYRWRTKYGGLSASELQRLKQLEQENRQLKKLVADLSLDKHVLQEVLAKKV